jgi:hypothetical protein
MEAGAGISLMLIWRGAERYTDFILQPLLSLLPLSFQALLMTTLSGIGQHQIQLNTTLHGKDQRQVLP